MMPFVCVWKNKGVMKNGIKWRRMNVRKNIHKNKSKIENNNGCYIYTFLKGFSFILSVYINKWNEKFPFPGSLVESSSLCIHIQFQKSFCPSIQGCDWKIRICWSRMERPGATPKIWTCSGIIIIINSMNKYVHK